MAARSLRDVARSSLTSAVYSREVSFSLLAVVLAIGAAPDALQCLAVEMGGVGAFELIPDAGPNFAEPFSRAADTAMIVILLVLAFTTTVAAA